MIGKDQVFSSGKDDWETPPELFQQLDRRFHFDLDAAASDSNHLCERYFTEKNNALTAVWTGNVFCNPPYSQAKNFIRKGALECFCCLNAERVVLLVAARTSNKEWHKYVFPYASELIFIDGRVKFSNANTGAPFPSVVVVFDKGGRPEGKEIKVSTLSARINTNGTNPRRNSKKTKSSDQGLVN